MDTATQKTTAVERKRSTLPPITTDSGALPQMPSVLNREAWAVPATPGDVREAVAYLLNFADIRGKGAPDDVVRVHVRAIAKRGYTRAELMLAMEEVPFKNTYGEGFRLDVLDEVITSHRELRRKLGRMLTAKEVGEITDAFGEVDPECFVVVSFDSYNNPLYRYSHGHKAPQTTPTPELPEKTVRRTDQGSGTLSMGDLLNRAQEEAGR